MKKIWINGSFDIIHVGHIRLINYAKSLGVTRIGLDSDERISSKKGTSRPFTTLQDRSELISSINGVNSVVHFNTDDELVARIIDWKPDIMVIGSDYVGKKIIGSEHIGEILFYRRSNDSTTGLIEKIIRDHEKNTGNR